MEEGASRSIEKYHRNKIGQELGLESFDDSRSQRWIASTDAVIIDTGPMLETNLIRCSELPF